MNPSRLFILRPVATSLLMIGTLLVGIVAYRQLPVSALPEVDYPTIQVMTFYPGADPTVMGSSVTAPLERQFGQVPGLSQMTSSSSLGSSIITLQFNLDQNIDIAEQEVQAAINSSGTYLPPDLPNPPIYSKVNPADAPILAIHPEVAHYLAWFAPGEKSFFDHRLPLFPQVARELVTVCQALDPEWEGVLKSGVYHIHKGLGVDESVMWGEYFFVEALEEALRVLGS